MTNRFVVAAAAVVVGLAAGACRSNTTEQAATTETPAASSTESHEGHQLAKVYFAEPKDGATVSSKSLTKFVFTADNYQISPVPQGEVKEARANMGHFHLGVDTDCLPPGTVIPKAEAGAKPGTAGQWIHFGTGSNNIEMALNPGPHKMSVQVGDDLHTAVEGLCQTITITAE
jgi:hypothetical protein